MQLTALALMVPECPDSLALEKGTIPQGSTLGIHSTDRVSARAMTMQIAWQIAISLGREAPSRALWFGKVQQTSRVQGSPFSAQGGHHPLHPGSSSSTFMVSLLSLVREADPSCLAPGDMTHEPLVSCFLTTSHAWVNTILCSDLVGRCRGNSSQLRGLDA